MKRIFLLLVFVPNLLLAQYDFKENMDFFQAKSAEYQKMIETKGLGELLKVDKVQFKQGKNGNIDYSELEMILLVKAFERDTASQMWNQMKMAFDSVSTDSLESFLFDMFIHKMEIPDSQGNIQIYFRNHFGVRPSSFYILIWSEDGVIKSEAKLDIKSKSKEFELVIDTKKIASYGRGKINKVSTSKVKSHHEVFNEILRFVKETKLEHPKYKYELLDRVPRIESDSFRTETMLKFTLANLGKEVLTDQSRYFWEKWVNLNSTAMERLTFRFEVNFLNNNSFSLKCNIDGKYGSGLFKPRVNGYMNMEVDFDDFFNLYKDNFKIALKNYLEK